MYSATKPATRLSLDAIAERLSPLIGSEVRVDSEDLGFVVTVEDEGTYWMEMTAQYWECVERPTSLDGWAEYLADDWTHGAWCLVESA